MKTERWKEMWDLPQEFLDMHEDAIAAEVHWHIFDVFGYETGVLSESEVKLLLRMFHHEYAHQCEDIYRPSACRAFARFVELFGGSEAFGFSSDKLADWTPCEQPFDVVDFERE